MISSLLVKPQSKIYKYLSISFGGNESHIMIFPNCNDQKLTTSENDGNSR